nr:DGQHR domain-containing protein [Treponema sp.]
MVYKDYSFLKAKQPIGTMYVCVIDKSFILKIAESDLRRNESDCRDVEEYVGIQRPLDKTRKKEIGKYVNLADAAFPNSIILSIPSNKVEFSQDGNKIRIADEEAIASILDGQHRLAGLENLEKDKDFDCIVTL